MEYNIKNGGRELSNIVTTYSGIKYFVIILQSTEIWPYNMIKILDLAFFINRAPMLVVDNHIPRYCKESLNSHKHISKICARSSIRMLNTSNIFLKSQSNYKTFEFMHIK